MVSNLELFIFDIKLISFLSRIVMWNQIDVGVNIQQRNFLKYETSDVNGMNDMTGLHC